MIASLKRNIDRAITRSHLRTFGISNHLADQVTPGLHGKAGFHGEAGVAKSFLGGVFQAHLHGFFAADNKIAVFIKDGGGQGDLVLIATIRFAEMHVL